jgi:hypothetical protein
LRKGNVKKKKNIQKNFCSGVAPLGIKIYYKLTIIGIVRYWQRKTTVNICELSNMNVAF